MKYKMAVPTLALVGLAACANPASRFADEALYPAGYNDGCETARVQGKEFGNETIQDPVWFETDRGYRYGWRQGYNACRFENYEDSDTGTLVTETPY